MFKMCTSKLLPTPLRTLWMAIFRCMIVTNFRGLHKEILLIIFPIFKDDLLEEIDRDLIEVLPGPFPAGIEIGISYLIQDSRCPEQHSKQGPSEMKICPATAKPACLLTILDFKVKQTKVFFNLIELTVWKGR